MGGLPKKPKKHKKKNRKQSYFDSYKDPYYYDNSVRIFNIKSKQLRYLKSITLKKLKLHSLPRASVYGRDGTNKGINLNKRMCYRHTYRYTNEDDRPVIDKVEEILKRTLSIKEVYRMDKSHFDILHYSKTSEKRDGFFDIHRDKINHNKLSYHFRQFSILICLDSNILSIDGGATHIYLTNVKHLFNESTMIGKILMFPSNVPHGSEELKIVGEYKTVLKLDIIVKKFYDPTYPMYGVSINNLNTSHYKYYDTINNCKCLKCNYQGEYRINLTIRALFYGKHKKINIKEILYLIASFRGNFKYIQKEEALVDNDPYNIYSMKHYRERLYYEDDWVSDCNGD